MLSKIKNKTSGLPFQSLIITYLKGKDLFLINIQSHVDLDLSILDLFGLQKQEKSVLLNTKP
jgi:hypothetical protein